MGNRKLHLSPLEVTFQKVATKMSLVLFVIAENKNRSVSKVFSRILIYCLYLHKGQLVVIAIERL